MMIGEVTMGLLGLMTSSVAPTMHSESYLVCRRAGLGWPLRTGVGETEAELPDLKLTADDFYFLICVFVHFSTSI